MKSANVKRSVVLGGHKTSISLEDAFWICLQGIAARKKMKLTALLQQIDNERDGANLSSAVRVYVLDDLRARGPKPRPPLPAPAGSA